MLYVKPRTGLKLGQPVTSIGGWDAECPLPLALLIWFVWILDGAFFAEICHSIGAFG